MLKLYYKKQGESLSDEDHENDQILKPVNSDQGDKSQTFTQKKSSKTSRKYDKTTQLLDNHINAMKNPYHYIQ